MAHTIRLSVVLILSTVLECAAQTAQQDFFPIEEIKSQCVEFENYPIAIASDECSVTEFDLLTELDGNAFFYARYQITAEDPSWPNLRDVLPEANALAIFVGQAGGDFVRIYRTYHENLAEFVSFAFPAPEIIETSRGEVLHVIAMSPGGGMQQWFNDEYWLWQWNDWQKIDVSSWYARINSYVPPTYAVNGVSAAHFDLVNLRTISPVRRPQDPQCCPSGGIVTVSFDWIDFALTIREVVYDPDVDFRSLVE